MQSHLSLKVQSLLDKLGIRVRFVAPSEMPDENTAGYYNMYSNEIVLPTDFSHVHFNVGSLAANLPDYVALHEVIHWEMHQAVRDAIVLSLLGAIHPKQDYIMEEISAEAGAEKLIKDYLGVNDMHFVAERINKIVTATRPRLKEDGKRNQNDIDDLVRSILEKGENKGIPTSTLNDSIARGISAAEEVEKKIA